MRTAVDDVSSAGGIQVVAKRTGSGSLMDAPPAPVAPAPSASEPAPAPAIDPVVTERLMTLARILTHVEDGMSFVQLRAAMSLSSDELRTVLGAGLQSALVRPDGRGATESAIS